MKTRCCLQLLTLIFSARKMIWASSFKALVLYSNTYDVIYRAVGTSLVPRWEPLRLVKHWLCSSVRQRFYSPHVSPRHTPHICACATLHTGDDLLIFIRAIFNHTIYASITILFLITWYANEIFSIRTYSSISMEKLEARTVDYTGRFIMFSVIANIYNKKTKRLTLMKLFTATGKLKKFVFWQLEMFDMCTTCDMAHIDKLFKFLPHTRQHGCIDILYCCNDPCL
jgi:hypothetical protein